MAYVFSTNNVLIDPGPDSAPNGDLLWYNWKEFMKGVGWTVKSSSDGLTTFSTSGDIITKYSSGAGGLGNSYAWFVIREPVGGLGGLRREFLVFKNVSGSGESYNATSRMVVYSAGCGFSSVAGHGNLSISAANPPIAFDEVWYTTSQPTNCFSITAAYTISSVTTTISNIGVGITDYSFMANNSAPYEWYIISTVRSIGAQLQAWYMAFDPLTNYDLGDPDPTVWHAYTEDNSIIASNITNVSAALGSSSRAWHNWRNFFSKADSTSSTNGYNSLYTTAYTPNQTGSGGGYPSAAYSTYNGSAILIPCPMLVSTYAVYKGTSTLHKLISNSVIPYSTLTVNSTRDWLAIGAATGNAAIAIPWDGSIYNR